MLLSEAIGRVQSQVTPPSQHLVLVLDKVKSWGTERCQRVLSTELIPRLLQTRAFMCLWMVTLGCFFPRTCKNYHGKACPASGHCRSPGCPPSTSYSATLSLKRWETEIGNRVKPKERRLKPGELGIGL